MDLFGVAIYHQILAAPFGVLEVRRQQRENFRPLQPLTSWPCCRILETSASLPVARSRPLRHYAFGAKLTRLAEHHITGLRAALGVSRRFPHIR
jgi:hypothetical protein